MDNDRRGMDMVNWVDKVCNETCWYTPIYIIAALRIYCLISTGKDEFADVATSPWNPTGAESFITEATNSLKVNWPDELPIFINPPYGEVLQQFTSKIHREAHRKRERPILALLPCGARFSTKYWQKDILNDRLNQVCFINHRVSFLTKDGQVAGQNPYDSMIYGFNSNPVAFKAAFKILGRVCSMEIEE